MSDNPEWIANLSAEVKVTGRLTTAPHVHCGRHKVPTGANGWASGRSARGRFTVGGAEQPRRLLRPPS